MENRLSARISANRQPLQDRYLHPESQIQFHNEASTIEVDPNNRTTGLDRKVCSAC